MGSLERSKKKVQLWKKAIVHFSLCFVLGFFTGFAPSAKTTMFLDSSSPQTVENVQKSRIQTGNFNGSSIDGIPTASVAPMPAARSNDHHKKMLEQEAEDDVIPRRLVIIVTPTSLKDRLRFVLLTRMANTLKLVRAPLLWVVVEQHSESDQVSELLRKTGVMYRHLVFKENFTDVKAEMDHQRNVALNHIEHHKLSGIVHFAGLNNVYDLSFFEEIRGIEVFGTWPMALLYANRKKVLIEGPVCDSSEVIGWHLKKLQNLTDEKPPIHISSFAFNSSILWDPERWGRTSSLQDTSQDSLKFVRKEVLQEETKLKGVPSESCSKILLWNLDISRGTPML